MRRPAIALALAAALLALAGCYRPEQPPSIGERVAVRVVASQARLVLAQAYLQDAIAAQAQRRLGWDIDPVQGSARLDVVVDEERIAPTAKDGRDVPVQWSVRLTCTVLLAWRGGTRTGRCSGIGYYTGPGDQAEGVRTAAEQAAGALVDWIEAMEPRPADQPPAPRGGPGSGPAG